MNIRTEEIEEKGRKIEGRVEIQERKREGKGREKEGNM